MNKKPSFENSHARHKAPPQKIRSEGPRPPSTSRTEMSETASYEFFLICQPGFEDLLLAELGAWNLGPQLNPQIERGGVTVTATLSYGFALNQILRIPNRILLRLADFGCRDFPKLYKKMAAFPWENWLPANQKLMFSASSSNSWLKIKKRIEETCSEGLKARLKSIGSKPLAQSLSQSPTDQVPIEVQIRFVDDVCTVSLDTSGEILHKRGSRPLSSLAPLRESTAAALLRLMIRHSRHNPPHELVDPMTGSGTFLIEAALLNRQLTDREFAFTRLTKVIAPHQFPDRPQDLFAKFVGFDSNSRILEAARENLAKIKTQVKGSPQVELRAEDFLKAEPLLAGCDRWLIANPPYGERIAVDRPLKQFYESLMAASEKVARPSVSCFIFPESIGPSSLRHPENWLLCEQLKFSNGGIPVVAHCYVTRSD